MIDEPTVFILGAGASTRYNYPTGAGLKEFITSKLFMELFTYFRKRYTLDFFREHWERRVREFVEAFRDTTGSIDLFLSRRPEFTEIGKLAILYSIFHYEEESSFGPDSDQKKGDWYSYLYERMTADARKPGEISLSSNKISFITFNYDRSLEQFLYNRSINSFGEEFRSKILKQLGELPIIHVYGKVADLEWEEAGILKLPYNANPNVIDFLTDPNSNKQNLGELRPHWRGRIFIIDEERSNYQDHIDKMKDIIRKSKRIYFLGFGFADENMNLLGFPNVLRKEHRIYGTTIDKTPHEIRNIQAKYMSGRGIDSSHFNFEDINCLKLLRNHL